MESRGHDQIPSAAGSTVWPIAFAAGTAVLLVGLIVNLEVVAPLGGAIALAAGVAWARAGRGSSRAPTPPQEPAPEPVDAERFPRSRLLERGTLALGGLVVLGAAAPAAGLAILPSLQGGRARAIDLGPLSAFPEGVFVVASFLSDPQAGEISRRAAYVRNNGLAGGVPSFTIMSSRCTHVGCPTQPNGPALAQEHRFERTSAGTVSLAPVRPAGFGCPCHGSQFDTEGNRTAGPAARGLDRYRFSIRNGRLVLGPLFSVSRVDGTGAAARIHAFPLKPAGQPVTGPESLLYPTHLAS